MFHQLPFELVREILLQAARMFVPRRRSDAVNLALVSSAAYTVTSPVLYHTLVITESNEHSVIHLDTLDRVLAHVRYMHIVGDQTSITIVESVLAKWQPSGTAFLDARWDASKKYLVDHNVLSVCGLRVIYKTLFGALGLVDGPSEECLPPSFRHRLTHLVAYLPDADDHPSGLVWSKSLLVAAPALTHITLMTLETKELDEQQQIALSQHLVATLVALSLLSSLQCICLRVGGNLISDATISALRDFIMQSGDERLKVWFDVRLRTPTPEQRKWRAPCERLSHSSEDDDDDDRSSESDESGESDWDSSNYLDSDAAWDRLDESLEIADSFALRDHWQPEDRPESHGTVLIYHPPRASPMLDNSNVS
ncbi:hypothetical protein BKA62DRAFT_674971 [Auriculariales sp. MPI-PUGE-AT-0066]|nr:hypothetical protein BKA62DRAFT_674971 [Auriculariales sp. MPI-PUGE-AT-0066]